MWPFNMDVASGRYGITCLEVRCSQVVIWPASFEQNQSEILGENTVEWYKATRSTTVLVAVEVTKLE